MRLSICILFLFFSIAIRAQSPKSISFNITFNDQAITIEKEYYSKAIDDSIHFEALRFYISDIQLFKDDVLVGTPTKKHILLDLEKPASLNIDLDSINASRFNTIKFNLGIDSLTNVSGAFGGDLDPTNGMYWTWQSGYINFKLEGVSKACPARHHFFQYHLGGYQAPFSGLQEITLKDEELNQANFKINVAIDQLFAQINIKEIYQIMSPNQQAVDMAKLVTSIFSISK